MRARRLNAAVFATASFLAAARAAGDPQILPAISQEISPAPRRAMHRASGTRSFLLGLDAETARVVTSSGRGWGVIGGLWASWVTNAEWLSGEGSLAAALGGGSGGLAGQLDARLLFGWRGYVTDWQGPFVRVGVESQLFGSFLTLVSLPAGVVGYELMDDRVAFDVGLHGAFAESAGYRVDAGASRDLSDSPLLGAYAWMIAPPVQTGFRWDRLWPHNQVSLGQAPIDDLRGSACVAARRSVLMVCANLDLTSGPAAVTTSAALLRTTGIEPSISFGFGGVGTRAVAPPAAR
jgi:hypothetical protein